MMRPVTLVHCLFATGATEATCKKTLCSIIIQIWSITSIFIGHDSPKKLKLRFQLNTKAASNNAAHLNHNDAMTATMLISHNLCPFKSQQVGSKSGLEAPADVRKPMIAFGA